MSEQKVGIQELKEALVGINLLAVFLAEHLKDGLDIGDGIAVWQKLSSDEEFKQKLISAFEGIKAVPEEIKDMDLAEGIELMMLQAQMLPVLLAAFKKA